MVIGKGVVQSGAVVGLNYAVNSLSITVIAIGV
jgi:hypothetical protein